MSYIKVSVNRDEQARSYTESICDAYISRKIGYRKKDESLPVFVYRPVCRVKKYISLKDGTNYIPRRLYDHGNKWSAASRIRTCRGGLRFSVSARKRIACNLSHATMTVRLSFRSLRLHVTPGRLTCTHTSCTVLPLATFIRLRSVCYVGSAVRIRNVRFCLLNTSYKYISSFHVKQITKFMLHTNYKYTCKLYK